jgi:hypothetical protein
MAPVTSARGLAETDSSEGGAAAENQTELLKHEWHHSRGTSARRFGTHEEWTGFVYKT